MERNQMNIDYDGPLDGPIAPHRLDNIESPYMDQRRMIQERVEAGQRAIQSLFVWKLIGIMGWLAFGVVVWMR